jgi:hypothetical protein
MASLTTDWQTLRQQARRQESNIESKMEALTKVANNVVSEPSDVESNVILGGKQMLDRLQAEIQSELRALQETNEEMQRHDGSMRSTDHALMQRHRQALGDYQSEFTKTKRRIREQRNSVE